ncbi:unnamed protein product [Rotaria sordida]|uniref:Uncharacterized protein n=1 Tax=Rotaria sordida TaxID=392033 RepID=A0A819ZTT5_9BILA|nr:unnamed protein product [Rotaria sordida]
MKYYQQSYDMLINAQPQRELASSYVLSDIGWILHIKGQYNEALDHHKRALKIRKTYSNYLSVSSSLTNIGIIYKKIGKYNDALDCLKESLQIKEKYLPHVHQEIAKILSTIATIYSDMDELDNSLEYHQKSLEMIEKCLPFEHENIAINLNHIGTILTKKEKYDEALDYFIRALKIKENIFPNGHLSIALSLNNIGYIYYRKKDYTLALDYFEKSMNMRENLYSNINNPMLVNLLTNFGLVYLKLHKYDSALTYHVRALNVSRIILPSGHFTITECLTNIAIVYREMKDYVKAFQYFEKALKNEGENPTKGNMLRLAYNYDNMGVCLCYQGDAQTGLEYRMKAIRLLGKVYPRLQYARTADTIGDVYLGLERYDSALECFYISLNIKLKCLSANDVSTAETLMNIGDVFFEKEKNERWKSNEQYKIKSRFYYEKALEIYTKNKHVNTIHTLNRIGIIYEEIHKYHVALQYYRKALETFGTDILSDDSLKEICENNVARIKWLMN